MSRDLKLKCATRKLRTEALRRYRQRHRGSLDQAEEEMSNMLKSKTGRVSNSKTLLVKSVAADEDYDARLNVTGSSAHHNVMSGKLINNSQKTNQEYPADTERGEPNTDAAVGSHTDAENLELDSNYDKHASVFDDELVLDVKPAEEKLLPEKQHKISGSKSAMNKKGTLKTEIHFPELQNSSRSEMIKCVSDKVGDSNDVNHLSNQHTSETEDVENENLHHVPSDKAEDPGLVAAVENLEEHQVVADECGKPLLFSGYITSRSGTVSDVSSHSFSGSIGSSRKLSFVSTTDDNEAVAPVNSNRTSESHMKTASNSDWHTRSTLLASCNTADELKSSVKLNRSSPSADASEFCQRTERYEDSADSSSGGEEKNSGGMPSPLHLSSSGSSSDWDLASFLYEETDLITECSDAESTRQNFSPKQSSAKSGGSSANSSEWHIGSLLFRSSELSSRQLSGDFYA